ncbi:hypothetical protein FB45DRAFT_863462 [Roridomyces roridus]|uniref:Uncharacterized protein n=1 Tax=Roridomyces roridus TaxID=1738132 RepID=A0AAD7C3R4_9AGAR|nr:hypothetical protein FB45DRAFT_863462 [Roridomyces roridus]
MFDLADILIYASTALVASSVLCPSFFSTPPVPVLAPVASPVPTALPPALDWLALYLDALEDASPSFLHHHMPTFTTVDNKVLTLVESSLPTIIPSFACGEHFMCPNVVALNVVPSWSWSPELARAFTHAVDLAVLAAALVLLSGFIWWIASVEEAKTVRLDWAIVPLSPSNAAAGRVEYNLLPLVKEALSRLRIFVLDIALPYSHLDEMTGALVLFRKESFGHLAPLPALNDITGAMVLYRPAVEISPTTATPCNPNISAENVEDLPPRVQFLQASRVSERVRSRTAPAEPPVAPPTLPHLLDIPLYSFHLETAPSSDMPSAAINQRRVSHDRTVTCNDAPSTTPVSSRSRSKTAPGHLFCIPASSPTGAILALDLMMPSAPFAAPLPAVPPPSRPLFGNLIYQTARVEPQPRAFIPPPPVASNRFPPAAFAHARPKIIGGEHFDLSFGLAAKQRRRNGVV